MTGDGPDAQLELRQPTDADVEWMATFAEAAQADPETHLPYLPFDGPSIATDIVGLENWADAAAVAERNGEPVGWLVGEPDAEMGRVWWWGPYATGDGWDTIADRLYSAVRVRLGAEMTEEEACADQRSVRLAGWAARCGLAPDPPSVLLRRDRGPAETDARVRPVSAEDVERVQALHAEAFPGTHTTPAALLESDQPRLVIVEDGRVLGYVAVELQSDQSGYVDYLAVDPATQGRGLGGALVDHACHLLFEAGATHAHLSVREDNAAARALYARVGFIEERIATPYRKGFTLP